MTARSESCFDIAPYRLSGTVYGVLMNHHAGLAALGDAVDKPPYKGAPKSVVLYLKPRNTLVAPGQAVRVDTNVGGAEVGAALGIVIGRTACAVSSAKSARACRRLRHRRRLQRSAYVLFPPGDPLSRS
ncbi:MAG: fumarylacetoacetate hydrolase family protein [Pseudomonadota bacterium]|nr:fumarylacetoacetate hydrolase family protein [Pseudomonadota bacterium]